MGEVPEDVVGRSLAEYDAFYRELESLYRDLAATHERFLVLDLHTYNHRRDGPDAPPADPAGNPQVNVGTGTMEDRSRFAALIDRFMEDLVAYDFPGGRRWFLENVQPARTWAHLG